MWQLKIRKIVPVFWNGQAENKIKLERPYLKYDIGTESKNNILGAGMPLTALRLPLDKDSGEYSLSRWLAKGLAV